MSVALRGNLQDFGIADVFQLVGQQRKTGVLDFTGQDREVVQLRFDRGAVVSAAPLRDRPDEALTDMLVRCGRLTRSQVDQLAPERAASAQTVPQLAVGRGWITKEEVERIEDLLTRETLFELLRWKSGAFDFRAQAVEHDREVEALLGAEQILMDSLRMIDEWHSFAELVPSEDSVFQKTAGFEDYRGRTSLEDPALRDAQRVYQLVNGQISVRRIIDLSLLGTFDAVRLLADLRRCGAIEPIDDDALRRLRRRSIPRPRVGRAQLVRWLAGSLPVLLLAGVLMLALSGGGGPAPGDGFAIPPRGLDAARAAWEARRVRHALETHRYLEGTWPRTLAELEATGLLADSSLAGAGARPYYYVQRGEDALLLAPER